MKVLQSYSDWLLLNKGEINPEVDDIITYHNDNEKVEIRLTNVSNQNIMRGIVVNHSIKELINARASNLDIKDCYVEIDYNPNAYQEGMLKNEELYISIMELQAIAFAN